MMHSSFPSHPRGRAGRLLPPGALFLCLAASLAAPGAWAQQSPWRVYAGASHIGFSTSATIQANGSTVPGADAHASSNNSLGFGVIYDLRPQWSVELALGLPPTTTLSGRGALEGAGTLGKAKYGPAVLSIRHHWFEGSPVMPYVGAGINYTLILSERDGFVSQLHVKNGIGPVLQAGLEAPLNKHWSLFFDVKKIWLKTTASGALPALGGVPAYARVRLDPLVVTAGLSYRF